MVENQFKFTDARLTRLQPDRVKRLYFNDTVQPGLRIQLTPKGVITFQFQKWSSALKKVQTKTLGKYGANGIGIDTARNLAAQCMADIVNGKDIVQAAMDRREEGTFGDLFYSWLKEAKVRKRTWETDVRRYELYIKKPFGKRSITWFTEERVRRWHSSLNGGKSQRGGGQVKLGVHTANRCLALVSTVFNKQLPESPNPTVKVKPFKENSRTRFLQPDEMGRFFDALDAPETPEYLRDFVYLSLFTGARRGNIGGMQWNDISLKLRIWAIRAEDSKNKEPMVIPLSDDAIGILERRRKGASSVFVFPVKKGKTGHLQAPRKSWTALLKRAEISNLHFHDLRRSMGSYMAINGTSTAIIGKGLGHRDKKATQVYERLNLAPVRKSMDDAIRLMKAGRELPDKVVPINKKAATD